MHRPLSEHLVPTTIPCTRLPLELIEILISLAYDDEDSHTLVACTLVSRLWRWASRRSLFRKVTISSGVRLAQLEALLALDHSLASLIHCLVIRPDPLARLCPASSAWLVRLPDRLPSLLHNLEALHLVGIHHSADVPSWGGGSHRIRDHAVGTALSTFARFDAFTTVHTLVLRGCTLEPTCLYVLAGALPSLRRLAVSYLQVPQRSAPPPSPHHTHTAAATPRRPRLTALELDVGHIFSLATQSVLAWAAATPSCHSLRTAVLTVRTSDAEAAGRFLAAVGPRLHALDLRFEAYFGLPLETANMKQHMSLACCTSLRTLALSDPTITSRAICDALAEVRAPALRRIVLRLPSKSPDAASARLPDLSRLAGPLNDAQLHSLMEVCLVYHGPMKMSDVLTHAREALPELEQRGVLRVCREDQLDIAP